jgi:hypothetical protein
VIECAGESNVKPPKPQGPPKRWVWRISQRAPLGEWVDLSAPPAPPVKPAAQQERPQEQPDLPEVSTGGWVMSSFDLLRGTDVDASGDTVPDELFDELFPPKKDGTRPE